MSFLMKTVPGANRTKIKEFLSQKMVYVDHRIVTQYNAPLAKGQLVQICKRGNKHAFNNKFVKIVYEDAFILVVEKERGILTNAQPGMKQITVKSILDEYVKRQNRTMSVHTVHRLDRETSGLLLFAKRRDVQQMFVENWKGLVTDRRYIAVVQGDMEKDSGTVASWLRDNKMFVVYSSVRDNGGQYAVTHYQTLKRANGVSLVELKLETGRKNQIRVHMQDLHHPIVGDLKYGCDVDPVGRICLHAFRIEFVHPITKEILKFETPYPDTFCRLLASSKDKG
ncbi:MAG: RluA family pseudouridine synthase [Bacteroides sp.]|nr:RluA family pseudouridine synthase [Bacteroides sp.]MCM1419902.1 RluA family pseudouridine synthase [Bacteroides sp.]